ncbi:uncharacterized protein N7469_002450 [Penicillium citrinum]|uniref:Uncharacterized protein n=1 Tax=Penicillium citrinum TaxID=5077 RepID=A0A9W9PAC1_PENCI|nr:uncharacterized protein N7469_002450 [Penicillium citrinum]KAJ5240859.1 hypothetical protein N7469_002450 [Penicillium citrinum]
MMTKNDQDGAEIEYAADDSVKSVDGIPSIQIPASLAALSNTEFERIKHRATLKLDARIMPCMVLMYIMNYLDRQNIAAAKLADIEKDLKMTDVQYQTCVSILFVGYILMQVPSNIVVGSQLGNAFGGLFAVAILKLDGKHGLEGWRWLFLVEGVATVGLAIILAFILPNSLKSLTGFSKIENECLLWRFEEDQGQQDNADEVSAYKGVMMAVTDPKTWLLMGTLYCIYIVGAVTNFFPSVVATLGYSRNKTYGLTAPPYVLCVIAMIINGFHSDKKQERYWHIVCPMVICLVANILAVATLNTAARYVAIMLMPGSFYSAAVVVLSWVAGTLSQPSIKRASAIALINSVCNTPNVWGSYLYYSEPRYLAAFLVNLAASVLAIVLATGTRIHLRRQNNKLDRGSDLGKNGPTPAQVVAGFRYTS